MTELEYMHIGYDAIINEVSERARVLDLGCGDGELLLQLQKIKSVHGSGVEISEEGISKCVEKGLYVFHGDIDEGLTDYKDNSFDYVILNQTLQSTKHPDFVLKETMRISKNAIVSFPNFAYLSTRFQLLFKGKMPVSKLLPYEWYQSPNIHLLTIKDFRILCKRFKFCIKKEYNFCLTSKGKSKKAHFAPNIFAQYGLFVLDGIKFKTTGC